MGHLIEPQSQAATSLNSSSSTSDEMRNFDTVAFNVMKQSNVLAQHSLAKIQSPTHTYADVTEANAFVNNDAENETSIITMQGDTKKAFQRFVRGLRTSGHEDRRDYWMPDEISKECYQCKLPFTTFRRKHHCRVCGKSS